MISLWISPQKPPRTRYVKWVTNKDALQMLETWSPKSATQHCFSQFTLSKVCVSIIVPEWCHVCSVMYLYIYITRSLDTQNIWGLVPRKRFQRCSLKIDTIISLSWQPWEIYRMIFYVHRTYGFFLLLCQTFKNPKKLRISRRFSGA